jgi:ribonuclease G
VLSVLDQIAGRNAAALMVDGRMEEFAVDPAGDTPFPVPSTARGRPSDERAGRHVREAAAGQRLSAPDRGIAPGDRLIVQVSGPAEAGKATPVTTRLLFKSRFAIITPDAPGLNISRRIKDEALRAAWKPWPRTAWLGRPRRLA